MTDLPFVQEWYLINEVPVNHYESFNVPIFLIAIDIIAIIELASNTNTALLLAEAPARGG